MPKDCRENSVWIARINCNPANLLPILQTRVNPSLTSVGRFVNTIANAQIGPLKALPRANINDLGIRLGNRQTAHRTRRGGIKNGVPGMPEVGRLPNAPVVHADVKLIGTTPDSVDSDGPSTPKRPNTPPAEAVVLLKRDSLPNRHD